MRIPSGKVDQLIFFVALDSTDRVTRKTGLSAFTVYRSRNGGTATVYTTPTVTELSAANMPGVYALTVDEDTTIASGSDSEEYCVHITCSTMAPVTRTMELYRRDTTSGMTALIDSNGRCDVIKIAGTTQTARDIGASVLLAADQAVNATKWAGGTIPAPNVTGVPLVDDKYLLGTIYSTPATAGIQDINLKNVANVAVSTTVAQIGVNAVNVGGTAQTGRDIGASVLLSAGTGTGQLDFTSGVVKANLAQILGTALTETAGQIAAGFKKFFNIAAPAATMDHGVLVDTVTTATTASALTTNNDKSGYSLTQAFPANFAALGISVGGHVSNVDTLTTYTGDTPQTGDSFARIGAAGAGLTAIGDTRVAHLDADVSSRASPTNITAGTITTVTNVTTVNGLAAGTITAASIAADAITDAKVASDVTIASVTGSVGSVAGSVGSVTGNVGGNVTGSVGSVVGAVGSVTGLTASNLDVAVSTRLASSSYTAPPSAATIAQAVWDALTSALTTVGSVGKLIVTNIDAAISSRSTYAGGDTAGTSTLLSRLTSTRAGLLDNMDAAVSTRSTYAGADTAGTTTLLSRLGSPVGASISADIAAVKAVEDAVKAKTDNLPADPADASDIAAEFASLQSHGDGAWATATGFSTLDATAVENAVWDATAASHVTGGSFGGEVNDTASAAGTIEGRIGTPAFGDLAGDIAHAQGVIDSINGVASVLVHTSGKLWVLDDQGNPLPHTGGGSAPTAGEIADEVQTRTIAAVTTVNGLAANSITAAALDTDAGAEIATAVWASTTRRLSDGTNIVLAKGTGVTGFNDLSAAQVNAEADTALSDAGVTTARMGHLDADVTSRLAAGSYTAPDNVGIAAVKLKTDNLPSDPADASVIAGAFTALQSHGDGAWATGGAAPTVDAIADEVATRTIAGVTNVVNRVDANIAAVNGVDVIGTGVSGDEWSPAP